MDSNILFGKYEILSHLGEGSFANVYCSRHLQLECFRALKLIPKSSINSRESLISEALLLKTLNHPAIPQVYDVEEDNDYYYLVEEFIEGESLEAFLSHQSSISQTVFLEFSLQLSDIFLYLHHLVPTPVLYLDLKPEHIIVCGTQLKLIDFNVATFLSKSGNILNLFGNRDFTAPELFEGSAPNPLCDIYSIGKIMEYLSGYLTSPLHPTFHQIIKKAAQNNPNCRFETVDSLISALKTQKNLFYQPHLGNKIAIYGSHAGCGSTHIAISLVSFLNYSGFDATYYNRETLTNFLLLPHLSEKIKETNGLLHYRFFKGYPNYGPGICLPEPESEIAVYDCGNTLPNEPETYDTILYICSNAVWHRQHAIEMGESLLSLYGKPIIICNLGTSEAMRFYAKWFHLPVISYAYHPDPFCVTQAIVSFFTNVLHLHQKRRNDLFFHLKNMFSKKP